MKIKINQKINNSKSNRKKHWSVSPMIDMTVNVTFRKKVAKKECGKLRERREIKKARTQKTKIICLPRTSYGVA